MAGVAVIAALGASFAAYLGARAVEDSKTDAAARGVARVLQARFSSADIRLQFMLENDRLVARDETFIIDLPIDDEELIASNLSADQWERVVTGLAELRLFRSANNLDFRRAEAGLSASLSKDMRAFVRRTHEAVARAYAGLAPLSGIS